MSSENAAERFVEIRNRTGMNRKDFANWLDIPYRTMQEWELGRRVMPEYLLKLVDYKVQHEFDGNSLDQRSVSEASFGLRLKEVRSSCGMRQEDVAEMMGMKRPTLSAIEADKRQVKQKRLSDLLISIKYLPFSFYMTKYRSRSMIRNQSLAIYRKRNRSWIKPLQNIMTNRRRLPVKGSLFQFRKERNSDERWI